MPEREPSILRETPAGADDESRRSGEPGAVTDQAADQGGSGSEPGPPGSKDRDAPGEAIPDEPAGEAVPDEPAGEAIPDEPAGEAAPREPAAAQPVRRQTPATRRSPGQAPMFYVAGFWRRLVAAALDLAIILPVALLLGWIAGALTGVHVPPSRHRGIDFWLDLLLANDPALIGIVGLTLAVATVYALIFQIVLARTPGMRIMKIRIIDQYGELLTTGRAAARTAGYLAALATLGLGFIWIGFDSEKRGLHDWVSGTYVVKA
jgi:uncharacterized RDD family membrane protein YckC